MSKRSRKILFSGMAAALLSCACHNIIAAPSLSLGVAGGAPTAKVEVPVVFFNSGSVAAIHFDIYYDPAQLSSGNPVAGDALGAHGLSSSLIVAGDAA